MPLAQARVIDDGKAVDLTWTSGERARFHALWLRDNALDPETRSPGNGQRLITVLDIPPDTAISEATITGQGNLSLVFRPENKAVVFPAAWLRVRRYDAPPPFRVGQRIPLGSGSTAQAPSTL